jgi:hypothetical protein
MPEVDAVTDSETITRPTRREQMREEAAARKKERAAEATLRRRGLHFHVCIRAFRGGIFPGDGVRISRGRFATRDEAERFANGSPASSDPFVCDEKAMG